MVSASRSASGTLAGSSVYGAELFYSPVTFKNLITGDSVSPASPITVTNFTEGHMSTSGHLNAGTYNGIESLSIRLSGKDASNYLLSGLTGAYKVSKLGLTVTANNQSRYYGVVNPIFTGTITGFVSGENKSIVTGKAIGINTANKKTLPGTSVITASNKGLSAANYTFNKLINGVLENK